MDLLDTILNYLGNVFSATFFQVLSLFGFFFIFGILLYFLSRTTRKAFVNSYNEKLDLYITGWIGTPVHELGHAFFCLVFGHRIDEIKLYSPNSIDGTMGYVSHSYDPDNIYQKAGNFFIGMGPIIFGSIILYSLMYFMLPNFNEVSTILKSNQIQNANFFGLIGNLGANLGYGLKILGAIFTFSSMGSLLFWLFLYLAFAIASHMQLSPPDIKSMLSGIWTIILAFLTINLITILFGFNITGYILRFSRFTGFLLGLFLFSTVISLVNLILTCLVLNVFHYRKYRRFISVI